MPIHYKLSKWQWFCRTGWAVWRVSGGFWLKGPPCRFKHLPVIIRFWVPRHSARLRPILSSWVETKCRWERQKQRVKYWGLTYILLTLTTTEKEVGPYTLTHPIDRGLKIGLITTYRARDLNAPLNNIHYSQSIWFNEILLNSPLMAPRKPPLQYTALFASNATEIIGLSVVISLESGKWRANDSCVTIMLEHRKMMLEFFLKFK